MATKGEEKEPKTKAKTVAQGKPKSGNYDASSIQVLEGLDPVRKRPGMYIGTTGPDGLHHLIWEIFDNSRDEAMGGFANDIEVALLPNNQIRVADNGRGIPVDKHPKTKISALEMIMTTLHAGGKFGGDDSGYKVSGGLHGVGASVVNALSTWTRAEVHRDGGVFEQEYKIGKSQAAVKKIGSSDAHGTIITFQADPTIFPEVKYDWARVVAHLRQQAYLVKGTRITVIDARGLETLSAPGVYWFRDLGLDVPSMSFYFEGGLRSLVSFYNKHQTAAHKNIFYIDSSEGDVAVEVALQYTDDLTPRLLAFANNIYNPEHGTHITGFKTALTRTINSYGRSAGILKESEENFTGDDVLEGITAVVSIKMPEIQFEGQTKGKLGSVEALGATASVFGSAFASFLEENPDDARAIINKVLLALKARKAAKAAKDSVLRKGALEGMTLPGKLADCQTKNAAESELFIVEGDSAGGCFSGDTKVSLLDGREVSFEELVVEHAAGKENYCYTMTPEGVVAVAPILHPRITNQSAQVITVTLDTGEEIVCTPDHKFMLRDGSYKEAAQLTPEDSLMPLRRKVSELGGRITIKGYEMVYMTQASQWIFTHLLSDRHNLALGTYTKGLNEAIHHQDFNKRNNNPSNLLRLDKQEHLRHHTEHLEKTLHTPESKEKARIAHLTEAYREKIREIMMQPKMRALLSVRAKKQWENPEYKKFMTGKFLEFYHSDEAYRASNNAMLNASQKKHWSSVQNRTAQAKRTKEFYEAHPEAKVVLHEAAKQQWSDAALVAWRQEETKKQWTPEFRAKRKVAYNETYKQRALKALNDIWQSVGQVDESAYEQIRRDTRDKALLRFDTILSRYFSDNRSQLEESVANFNHRIVSIRPCTGTRAVYDLEVAGTHNFALSSGVFVHNSAKMGRDRRTQAILPLRGKILNIERARLDKMLASEQIKNMVIALGTAIGDVFDISKLRYHTVIIATDADVDGAHIRTLLLTLLYRHFRPVIDGGFIYIAQPPLYKIKRGKEVHYAYSDEEKFSILGNDVVEQDVTDSNEENENEEEVEEETTANKKKPKISIQRYKGLGEMNPAELWETTMNPANRVLKRVTVDDATEADRIFDVLMGTDVPSRKSFIQSNAKMANLDV